jgi:ribosomal protein S21
MGVKIEVGEREHIVLALRRFRKLMHGRYGPLQEMGRTRYFVKRTEIRRVKEYRKLFKSTRATYLAKRAGEQ